MRKDPVRVPQPNLRRTGAKESREVPGTEVEPVALFQPQNFHSERTWSRVPGVRLAQELLLRLGESRRMEPERRRQWTLVIVEVHGCGSKS